MMKFLLFIFEKNVQFMQYSSKAIPSPENENYSFIMKLEEVNEEHGDLRLRQNETMFDVAGPEQILFSLLQSPSYIFNDLSPLTSVLISVAIIIFSPYMYIFSIEGATVAYFSSVALGLDTDHETRRQHCLAGLMINNVVSLHLVPAPGSHVAGSFSIKSLSPHTK